MSNLHLVRVLLSRDGNSCFYCGLPLGTEPTIEHLLSKSVGGNEHPHNKALAHVKCNQLADDLPIVEKIKLRDEMRRRVTQQNA